MSPSVSPFPVFSSLPPSLLPSLVLFFFLSMMLSFWKNVATVLFVNELPYFGLSNSALTVNSDSKYLARITLLRIMKMLSSSAYFKILKGCICFTHCDVTVSGPSDCWLGDKGRNKYVKHPQFTTQTSLTDLYLPPIFFPTCILSWESPRTPLPWQVTVTTTSYVTTIPLWTQGTVRFQQEGMDSKTWLLGKWIL